MKYAYTTSEIEEISQGIYNKYALTENGDKLNEVYLYINKEAVDIMKKDKIVYKLVEGKRLEEAIIGQFSKEGYKRTEKVDNTKEGVLQVLSKFEL